MKKSLLFLFVCFILSSAFSQNRVPNKIIISGTVYGYSFDPAVKLLNKETAELEGSIGGVTITAFKGTTKLTTVKSSGNGTFSLELPIDSELKIEYSKDNHVTGSFALDLTATPADIASGGLVFENIEIAMNSFISDKTNDKRPFGKLSYNTSTKALVFQETIYDDKKKNKDNAPLNLMNKSIKKNLENNNSVVITNSETVVTDAKIPISHNTNTNNETVVVDGVATNEQLPAKKLSALTQLSLENITAADLVTRQAEIDKAWTQLEQDKLLAITPEDFAIIQAREELLVAAEKELADAKKYISLQDEKISSQQSKITLLILLILVLGVSVFFIVRYARQKTILSKELASKNKKITESIQYALRIQQSVLFTENQVQNLLPESFIYYKPLDIVSGDFYWVSQVDSKIILCVADCTGHGVPGAFMSLIGNTLMNQIVNEKKITDAGKILDKLHEGIIVSLRQSENDLNNQDGMDLSLCVIDKASKTIQYSGAMNPVYVVKNKEVITLEPSLKAIGGTEPRKKSKEQNFESQTMQLEKGNTVYLTSDGFMDQFGGAENLKFNLPRFKELLVSLDSKSATQQKNEMDKAFNNWKGKSKQIDDVLVVGFSI